ncbi:ABC transporter permease [Candidatus Clostridium stratigraminis]|uniref:ABC transporter permease n=1 Tax=Candidatus Clostridium stratigraminis TaxID=3381661 RepID=A0ABW8T6G4_9CLOT
MNIVIKNSINELNKMFLRKKNVFFLSLTAIITLFFSIVLNLFQNKFGITAVIGSNYSIAVLGFFVKIFLPLFIFLASADVLSGELQHKTLKLSITRPISRFKIYLSKNLAIAAYTIIYLLAVFIISNLGALFFSVKGDMVSGILRSFAAYAIDIIPCVVLTTTAVFIAQFFKSSSTALISSIFIYIALYFLSMFFPMVLRLSFTNYLDLHVLWLSGSVGVLKIINTLMMVVSYGIIFFSAGFYFFDKRNL